MKDYEKVRELFERLVAGYSSEDPDYQAAKAAGAIDAIGELFADCYAYADYCEWLVDHNMDPLLDFRCANTATIEEIIAEVDNGNTNPDGTYNLDGSGWFAHFETSDGVEFDTAEEVADYLELEGTERAEFIGKLEREPEGGSIADPTSDWQRVHVVPGLTLEEKKERIIDALDCLLYIPDTETIVISW